MRQVNDGYVASHVLTCHDEPKAELTIGPVFGRSFGFFKKDAVWNSSALSASVQALSRHQDGIMPSIR